MQVDLFKQDLRNEANRQVRQVTTRGYKLDRQFKGFDGLQYYFSNQDSLNDYRAHLNVLLEQQRKYSYIGSAGCDNLYELETLGIASNSRGYVMILDFSDCLDYVLHRLYGCKIDDIRKIKDYSRVSRALLNFNFASLDHQATFDDLMSVSNELRGALAHLADEAEHKDLASNDKAIWVIYRFYSEVLSHLSDVKYYVTMCICRNYLEMEGDKGVIRSMSYSSVLATVPVQYDKIITLHQLDTGIDSGKPKIEDYQVQARSYKPYEYMGEVIRQNEFSWKI